MSLLALVIVAGPASAQGPAEDQYAPSTPSVGGPEAPEPVTATVPGGAPAGTSGSGSDGEDSTSTPAAGSGGDSGTSDPAPAATNDESAAAATNAVEQPKNRDKGTVEGLAARGEQQREEAASAADSPATNLAASDDGGEDGLGIVLYAVLGLTLIWAIAAGISRRRHQDGHPA